MIPLDGTLGEGGGQIPRTALSLSALTGTAGSTSLVLQTVLPVLASLNAHSLVSIRGGTHNPLAPPVPFLQTSFLPLLSRLGFHGSLTLKRHGFYPRGGGVITCAIAPRTAGAALDLATRLPVISMRATILLAGLPRHIATREQQILAAEGGVREEAIDTIVLEHGPPGNAVWVTVEHGPCTSLFTGFGERGKRAEQVAREALAEATFHLASGYAVEEHLADQLLLYLALRAEGRFAASRLNLHASTNMEIIRRFLAVTFQRTPLEGAAMLVTCRHGEPADA